MLKTPKKHSDDNYSIMKVHIGFITAVKEEERSVICWQSWDGTVD